MGLASGRVHSFIQTVTAGAVALAPPTAFDDGQLRSFVLKAHNANGANVFVGDSGVTTGSGFELGAGEAVSIDAVSVRQVYIIGTAGDKVGVLGMSS